jgi:choline dehydrogenase
MNFEQTYDYIVIGAGSSGCVVANRLSADPKLRVLLVEAGGPDNNPDIHEPGNLLKLWGSEVDWKYMSEPQAGLAGRKVMISRGKVLGGCSSIYALIHVRGNRRDFDHWDYLGNHGWSFEDVLPFFKKSEDFDGGASEYHGAGGPLSVRTCPNPTAVAHAFVHAAVELGYDGPDWDYNGARQEDGASIYKHNITREGKRASTAVSYLKPILDRKNLTIQTFAQVMKIILQGTRAAGVEYVREGKTHQVKADKEVILSAGAFDSPRLLMLSGIGPTQQLKSHGVNVAVDLPGVGQNLQDHLLLPVMYRSKKDMPIPTFIAESGLFVRTRPGMQSASPDLQYHFSGGIPAFIPKDYPTTGPTFFFVPIIVQPESRGEVRLRSGNPSDPPLLMPNYLQCDADVQVHLAGIRQSRDLAQTKAMADFNAGEGAPGTDKSEAAMIEYIRTHASTVWHPVGTCKMGRDPLGVVDPELRVHGVVGLRIADASIMPKIVAGNTNATCVMIGEKAAQMILKPLSSSSTSGHVPARRKT